MELNFVENVKPTLTEIVHTKHIAMGDSFTTQIDVQDVGDHGSPVTPCFCQGSDIVFTDSADSHVWDGADIFYFWKQVNFVLAGGD